MVDADTERRIEDLKAKKVQLIERLKKVMGTLKYKGYEEKAFEPFLKEHSNVEIPPIRKRINELEFRIATQAYTPRIEREIVKKLKELEKEFEKYRAIETARRKHAFIRKDIEELEKEKKKIEEELGNVRDAIRTLYKDLRKEVVEKRRTPGMATLEEVGVFEEKKSR